MNPKFFVSVLLLMFFASGAHSQVPVDVHVKILKAEDARRYDKTLEDLLASPNAQVRRRAALTAGRIGDERAITALVKMLDSPDADVAAFALGEIESIKAADVILRELNAEAESARVLAKAFSSALRASGPPRAETQPVQSVPNVKARLVEAAGKIAAANGKDDKAKLLGSTVVKILDLESEIPAPNAEVIRLGLTAILRARPEGTDVVAAKFLTHADARIRADAANTLARVRAKNANEALRNIAPFDPDDSVRVNAIRALGAAEDKDALNLLTEAATVDKSPNVRIAAIRSLAALKDAKAADRLLDHGEKLLATIAKTHRGELALLGGRRPPAKRNESSPLSERSSTVPAEQNEFIELAVALGRILANTDNQRADKLFADFGKIDRGHTAEVYVARVRVGPKRGDGTSPELTSWKQYSTLAQMVGEFASIEPASEAGKQMKTEAPGIIRPMAKAYAVADPVAEKATILAAPDVLRAFARFKTDDLGEVLRDALKNKDVFIRATAAELLAEQPTTKENVAALETAFEAALVTDTDYNDAQLAVLDALFKLDKKQSADTFGTGLGALDYLVRKKAFDLLADKDLQKELPGVEAIIENARKGKKDQLLPYEKIHTKLGQVLNTDADYRRAVSRKNGSVRAVLTTQKGAFTIELFPEDAPLTVDNFVKLARSGYFNGLEVHRVVPNFVMQDGDPRGDGNGGPGWQIRCEINMLAYERGAVGMALSGKDTGGSQWFVTHSPQPHLDGGYTVFGRVNETDMKIVDTIVRGDRILSVKIVEGKTPPKRTRQKPAR